MPNWTENTLTINNLLAEEIEELQTHIQENKLFSHYFPTPSELEFGAQVNDGTMLETWKTMPWFQALSPEEQKERVEHYEKTHLTPEQAEELTARYGTFSGYWWNVNNWGTKWDIVDARADVEDGGRTLSATFLTAWAPPQAGICLISKLFPHASFTLTYVETGSDFLGVSLIKNGEMVEKDAVPSDLRSEWLDKNHPGSYDEEEEDYKEEALEAFWDVEYDLYNELMDEMAAELSKELVTA